MTATLPAPTYPLCRKGLHSLVPDNLVARPSGPAECRGCQQDRRGERSARVKDRMRQLLAGFAYLPASGWEKRSRCANAEPELFELADSTNETHSRSVAAINADRHAEAREYCEAGCRVVAQCLGYALMTGKTGTWGGELLTPSDWEAARAVRREMKS